MRGRERKRESIGGRKHNMEETIKENKIKNFLFFFSLSLCLAVLGFELRALPLLGRCCTT
jgi:hypothetical protein